MAPSGIGDSVEGVHAVAAAAAAGRVTRLIVDRGRVADADVASIVDEVRAAGGAVDVVDDLAPLATTTAPQGVVAETAPLPLAALADLVADPRAHIVVLDHLENPRNVGAVARSALAAGASGLVVASRRAAPLSAAAFKAAAGALEALPVCVVSSIPKALDECRRAGVWVVALDTEGDRSLFGLELLAEPVAIVVGSEGVGLARLTREKADVVTAIPMAPGVESLNAAATATLACFEVARMRSEVT